MISDANNVFLGASARPSSRERVAGCRPWHSPVPSASYDAFPRRGTPKVREMIPPEERERGQSGGESGVYFYSLYLSCKINIARRRRAGPDECLLCICQIAWIAPLDRCR